MDGMKIHCRDGSPNPYNPRNTFESHALQSYFSPKLPSDPCMSAILHSFSSYNEFDIFWLLRLDVSRLVIGIYA